MRISQVLPHVATNKPQLNSARPFQIHWTTTPSCNCVLGRSCQFGENGNASKDLEHPQATACISTDLTPKPSLKVVLPSNRNSFSNRTWALACALAKICLKGKMAGGFSTCMFRSLFPDIGHKPRRIPQWTTHWQHSLHIILYLKTPELIQANKTNMPKNAKIGPIYRNLRDVKQLKPHVITCHHDSATLTCNQHIWTRSYKRISRFHHSSSSHLDRFFPPGSPASSRFCLPRWLRSSPCKSCWGMYAGRLHCV